MRQTTRRRATTVASRRSNPDGQSSDTDVSDQSSTNRKNTREKISGLPFTRSREKEELRELNDRLSAYIDHVRSNFLGPELLIELDSMARSVRLKLDDISHLYEDELDAVRRSLDNVASKLADSQVELKAVVSAKDEVTRALEAAKAKESQHAARIRSLMIKLANVENELEELRSLQPEHAALTEQHAVLQKQLETETLLRTDLQNRLQTMTEQVNFKDRLLNKEREMWNSEAVRIRLETALAEQATYRVKLQEQLDQLRDEMTQQAKEISCKLEKNYMTLVDAEREKTKQMEMESSSLQQANDGLIGRLNSTDDELIRTRSILTVANRKIKELETHLADSKGISEDHRKELDRLTALLADQTLECVELAAIKVQLDAELAMYRKLLEAEESRCSLTPTKRKLSGKSVFAKNRAALKRTASMAHNNDENEPMVDLDAYTMTAACPPQKQVRTDKEDELEFYNHETSSAGRTGWEDYKAFEFPLNLNGDSSSGINLLRVTCSSSGAVYFAGADPGIGLVCIQNASDKAADLSRWSIHFGPTKPGLTDHAKLYEFPDSYTLQQHSCLQVFVCPHEEDEKFLVSPQKVRRAKHVTLYLVTKIPVWSGHESVLALRDSDGLVRAVCEFQPVIDASEDATESEDQASVVEAYSPQSRWHSDKQKPELPITNSDATDVCPFPLSCVFM